MIDNIASRGTYRPVAVACALVATICVAGRSHADEASGANGANGATMPPMQTDVIYRTVDGVDVKLDVQLPPPGRQNHAAVLLIHGGGWSSGDKAQLRDAARAIADRGYVAATIGYRLAPAHRYPAAVDDVRSATRFVKLQASQWDIDPDRVGAIGFSAGAHLAMMLAVADNNDVFEVPDNTGPTSDVAAAVSYFGPTDLAGPKIPERSREILTQFFGGDRDALADQYRQASPITHLDPRDAPMLLFQGTNDILVPADQAVRMAEAMTRNAVDGRVELLIGKSHGWAGETLDRTREESLRFFERHLLR